MNDLVELGSTALVNIGTATLRAARIAISASEELRAVFDRAATEGWGAEMLCSALQESLPEYLIDQDGIPEVAKYLAREFVLRDKTQTLLVSAETGIAVGQVSPSDFYQPPPVEREFSSNLATPALRIRPEIESAIVQGNFNRARETQIMATLTKKVRSTELQLQAGDARLLVATLKGRKTLTELLRQELPELLQNGPGMLGQFLGMCRIGRPEEMDNGSENGHLLRITAHSVVPTLDMLSLNFQHDHYTALKERVRSQWVRGLARQVASLAYFQGPVSHIKLADILPDGLLICDPNTAMALPGRQCLPVDDSLIAVMFDGPKLGIEPDSYVCESIERHGKWEVAAGFDVLLHLDPASVRAFKLLDTPLSGLSVEVVT